MTEELRFRAPYDGKRYRVSKECSSSRTHQSFKDECDVNVILRNYGRTGVLPGNPALAQFGDFTEVDFQEAMFLVATAKQGFASLSADIRDRFANDPGKLLAFLEDKANLDEAVKLGILVKKEGQAPAVPVAAAASSGPTTAPKEP